MKSTITRKKVNYRHFCINFTSNICSLNYDYINKLQRYLILYFAALLKGTKTSLIEIKEGNNNSQLN